MKLFGALLTRCRCFIGGKKTVSGGAPPSTCGVRRFAHNSDELAGVESLPWPAGSHVDADAACGLSNASANFE